MRDGNWKLFFKHDLLELSEHGLERSYEGWKPFLVGGTWFHLHSLLFRKIL